MCLPCVVFLRLGRARLSLLLLLGDQQQSVLNLRINRFNETTLGPILVVSSQEGGELHKPPTGFRITEVTQWVPAGGTGGRVCLCVKSQGGQWKAAWIPPRWCLAAAPHTLCFTPDSC